LPALSFKNQSDRNIKTRIAIKHIKRGKTRFFAVMLEEIGLNNGFKFSEFYLTSNVRKSKLLN